MGNIKSRKRKINKDLEKQKVCKVGLSLGRNELKVEGNFQMGYHSKTDKKYKACEEIDGKHMKPAFALAIIQEEQEEEEEEEEEN